MSGSTTCDARSRSTYTALTALTRCVCRPTGSPVFGLTSSRGKLLLETSSRIRCPAATAAWLGSRSRRSRLGQALQFLHLLGGRLLLQELEAQLRQPGRALLGQVGFLLGQVGSLLRSL